MEQADQGGRLGIWARVPAALRDPRVACGGLAVIGVLLRVRQYLFDRSLWLDEALLAHNVRGRSLAELAKPLDFDQGAPLGFLWVEKLATMLLGPNERALRLFPLLCGCAAMLMFANLARRSLAPAAAVVAVLLFALHDPLIYYSAEVKQYSTDVAATVLLFWVAERCFASVFERRWVVAYGVCGVVALWFSHAAIFVTAGVGVALFLLAVREGSGRGVVRLARAGVLQAVSFAGVYFVSLRALAGNENLQIYWQGQFLPFPVRGVADLKVVGRAFYGLIGSPGDLHPQALAAVLAMVGMVVLFVVARSKAVTWVAPLVVLAVAAAAHRYPMGGRLALFVVPTMLLSVGAAVGVLTSGRRGIAVQVCGLVLLAGIVAMPVWRDARYVLHPRTRQEIRPVLAELATRVRVGDAVYVHFDAGPAFTYYARQFGIELQTVVRGVFPEERLAEYDTDLARLRGCSRAWFVFSHIRAVEGVDSDRYILGRLDGMGKRVAEIRAEGAGAYLYDLGAAPEAPRVTTVVE